MDEIRWKLFEAAALVAYILCPDKKALELVMKHGSITSRAALDEIVRKRASE